MNVKLAKVLIIIVVFGILVGEFLWAYPIHDYPTPEWLRELGLRVCFAAYFAHNRIREFVKDKE